MNDNLISDIARYVKKLMINDTFYGLFISSIDKKEDKNIPLAAVELNKSTMEVTLLINPDTWWDLKDEQKYGVIKHETLHLCFFHLVNYDKYSNKKMANVATDCEINQYIEKDYLPEWGVFIENLRKEHPELDWKTKAGSDHYYKELSKLSEEDKQKMGIDDKSKHVWKVVDSDGNPSDKPLTNVEKKVIEKQLKHTMEEIVEQMSKNQGHIPSEISQLVSGFVKPKPKFNYKKYIRNFVGNSTKYDISTSKVRENQRFPSQPKVILKPRCKILILIDESGSVSQNELYDFLNEIHHLSRSYDIEIRPFDTEVGNITRYKGDNKFKRTNCGGTSFTAAVDFYNRHKSYNSCIIFTDGYAEEPPKVLKRMLWVISSNGSNNSIKNHNAPNIKLTK